MQQPLLNSTGVSDPSVYGTHQSPAAPTEGQLDWHLNHLFATDPRQGCELLFRKYYGAMCSHTIRYVYSKEVAEDIVSEIFYNFWKEKLYLTITTSYQAYLFRAVRYRTLNYLRWELSKSRQNTDAQAIDLADYQPSPSEIVQYDELHRKVEQAIDKLSPQCKRAFLLSRFEGKKYGEIADELNINVKTVETHMSKALAMLRTVLKEERLWVFGLLLCQ